MGSSRSKRRYTGKTNIRTVRRVRYRSSYMPYVILGLILLGGLLLAFIMIVRNTQQI